MFRLKIDKTAWLKLKKEFIKSQELELQLGWFEGQRYGNSNDNLPMAQVAQWQEEGLASKNIPPRPFMRVGLRDALQGDRSAASFRRVVSAVAQGTGVFKALHKEGRSFRQILRQVMIDWNTPRNAKSTEDAKGFNDPLIDTSQLISNVTAIVVKE